MIDTLGQEVLVVDADPKVQKGMEHLLRSAGVTPTMIADPARAYEMVQAKFFAVALVDLDTPRPEGGLDVLREIRNRSPKTALIAMAPRRIFDSAVIAFRAGADDVIAKTPDSVDYLRSRVLELASGKRREAETAHLVDQAAQMHEDLMNVLLSTYRRVQDLEQGTDSDNSALDEITTVLLVEDDGWLGSQLQAMLDERYELESVSTGGEALDVAGRRKFQIALVKDALPDLPGSMVVRTIKAQSTETIVLLFNSPLGGRAGSVQVIETSRTIPFLPAFTQPKQLADRLEEVREAYLATTRERKYLSAFRQQHFDLLKRYAEMKQKLARAKGE